ncbi:hypothetical protein A6R68_22434, partial [Neotoma lepida]
MGVDETGSRKTLSYLLPAIVHRNHQLLRERVTRLLGLDNKSRTDPAKVTQLAKVFLEDYIHVDIGTSELRVQTITLFKLGMWHDVEKDEKHVCLMEETMTKKNTTIVFVETK